LTNQPQDIVPDLGTTIFISLNLLKSATLAFHITFSSSRRVRFWYWRYLKHKFNSLTITALKTQQRTRLQDNFQRKYLHFNYHLLPSAQTQPKTSRFTFD